MASLENTVPDFDTIVIGSGAGGLTAALALARIGQRVLVLEQHSLPGGWCHSFSLNGFLFSPGVHYIGQLHPRGRLRRLYEGLGVANDLTFLELNPDGFDHIIIGGKRFDIPKGLPRYIARLKQEFPAEADKIEPLFRVLQSLANAGGIRRSLRDRWWLLTYGLRSMDHLLNRFGIRDRRLRAVLTMQAGDHGMGPCEAPAALHAAVMAHYFEGAYYPKGGARMLPRAFIRGLRRHGGDIRLSTPVARIVTEPAGRRRRVTGVETENGDFLSARQVLSNADPEVTFNGLVGTEHLSRRLRRRLARTEYSLSAISLFCATNLDLEAKGLDSGNYWFAEEPRVEDLYDLAKQKNPLAADTLPGIFLTVTTLKDRAKRSDGLHTLECFAFVSYDAFAAWQDSAYDHRPKAYEVLKTRLTAMMLHRMDQLIPDLSSNLVFSSLGTPLTNAHYIRSTRGNLYGTAKRWNQIGPWSYSPRTEIGGLYLCGASTAAHGVAGATETGIIAAAAVAGCHVGRFLGAKDQHLMIEPCEPAARPSVSS